MSDLTVERLRELLDYDPVKGVFVWRHRADARSWNARYAGQMAGSPGANGYWRIRIDDQHFLTHRLAWLYVHGEFPPGDLDHKDGQPGNDWIENLRPATKSQNLGNQRRRRNNTSGFKGVSRQRGSLKWRAGIHVAGTAIDLGLFETPELAHAAYMEAAVKHFGPFARAE